MRLSAYDLFQDGFGETHLSTLPAANVDILESILQSPLVPLPAYQAHRRGGVPSQHLSGDGSSHEALERGPSARHWRLGQPEGVRRAITYIGFGRFLKDLRKDFVWEVGNVHYKGRYRLGSMSAGTEQELRVFGLVQCGGRRRLGTVEQLSQMVRYDMSSSGKKSRREQRAGGFIVASSRRERADF